ncbi:MAG: PHP domain-containing protein [Candidatus Heimdallarchaeota archaeon]|nr:PHP domain-containing protein [Candidatus Heimdallarchaeota archaeon]
MQIDMHVHSNISFDSKIKIGLLLKKLKLLGLDGIAITDHDSNAGTAKAKELAKNYDVKVFSAVEVTTRKGHILIYGIDDQPPFKRSVEETLDWVRDHDGAAVCAHPYKVASPSLRDYVYKHKFDAIEINAKCSMSQNKAAETIAHVMNIPLIGGSDAHFIDNVGNINTSFYNDINDEAELVKAIKDGKYEVMYRIPITIEGELLPPIPEDELDIFDKILEEKKQAVIPTIEAASSKAKFFDAQTTD